MGPVLGNDVRGARSLVTYGRLKSGVTIVQANKELAGVSEQLNKQYEPNNQLLGRVTSLKDEFLDNDVRVITTTMFGAVTLVLLIACANVANLMLTRAAGRQKEIAVRAAIGAGRGRIIRQLLTESLMLAITAGAVALPLTWIGLKLIDRGIPPEDPLPWFYHWSLDGPTLLYTLGVAALTSIAFGLIPALSVSRGRLYDALRDSGGRGTFGSAKRNKMRSALVISEIALALILLVGASLFTRTFFGLQQKKLGFDTSKVLTMRFFMPGQRYDSAAAIGARVQDIVQRIEGLPNVEFATASNSIPLGSCCAGSRIIIDGQRVEKGREPRINWTGVSGHWLGTFGVPLVAGREFNDVEVGSRAPVAVVDQQMVAQFWPKTNPIGQRFRLANDTTVSYEIIGVATTMRLAGLDNTGTLAPVAYLPFRFLTSRNTALMVRVRNGNPTGITTAVRNAIREADPTMPVFDVQTMDKVKYLSFWQYKLFSEMFGTFGAIALLLAGIGVYGVISYGVSQRTQEFGVRVALGAQGRHVFSIVLREASWLAGIGVALGIAGAFGVTRVIASILIGVSPTDPLSFGSVAVFLTAVALVASYIPARRATRVDPLVALRAE
jgi:predicted permease